MKEIEDYINKYLLNSATFILEKGHKSSTEITNEDEDDLLDKGIYFFEKNSNPKIFHLIFANDNSIAGTYYNSFSIKFLENSFQQQVTDIDKFDVIKSVKERFIEKSKEIIELKDKEIKQIKLDDFEEQNNFIKLKNEQNITLKKCLIDELGFSNLKGNGFEPNYNYYKKDDNIIIRLEGPGNCNLIPSIDYAGEYTIIRLQGTKKKDKEPEKLEDNIHNTREFGDYILEIPLKTEDFIIINENPIIEEKKGVLEIKYKLDIKKEPQRRFDPEDEI
jgi:HSP20 family molecular chaperone IbpA